MVRKEKTKLTITLYEDDSIKVEGPVSNKAVAYGMLALAKDAIFELNLTEQLMAEKERYKRQEDFYTSIPRKLQKWI